MKEQEALSKMVVPSMPRKNAWRQGIIQIWITRSCDLACYNCTQGSNLRGNSGRITPDQFEEAVISLKDYFGVVGMFGGNPAIHPEFDVLCSILREHIPFERRGLWCNNPLGKGAIMRETFNPAVSNLNVHLKKDAYDEFNRDWPECSRYLFGLVADSRHAPVHLSMEDLGVPEDKRWELIANCDINKYWSAMIGVFRGQLRGYFCEVAGAQAILHQNDPEWPDTGVPILPGWWTEGIDAFADQVRFHCHKCGVPLRGHGALAQGDAGVEQTSLVHLNVFKPKDTSRQVQVVETPSDLDEVRVKSVVDYIQNAKG